MLADNFGTSRFALFLNDHHYAVDGPAEYAQNVTPATSTQGKTQPSKRSVDSFIPDRLALDDGNTSRIISSEELRDMDDVEDVTLATEEFQLEIQVAQEISMQAAQAAKATADALAAPPVITAVSYQSGVVLPSLSPPSGPRSSEPTITKVFAGSFPTIEVSSTPTWHRHLARHLTGAAHHEVDDPVSQS